MARPRKATNVLHLAGAFKKDPQRAKERANEPEPKAGIGPAPDWFEAHETVCWDYLVSIAPIGVFGDSDRAYLEQAARLLSFVRKTRIAEVPPAMLARLEMMLDKMGLNPSARSKVKVPKQEKKNGFLDI